ncbi:MULTISPECIES: carbon-nitrogen hydrolase family protein [unclassified Brenneria]|uniref:carbon-nitrogen hydrolase family protein n=1 Tax=unclassified Brenneria TaxID=2634434 RepID=UPI0029C3EA24|nr:MULTISPECIES: carbon-nitrogen hydrolase family protein [unclassified Brenneria]MDX5629915.1 carbon-nitrogen hydrolase family protein [Brenneria sp. L3-3Z]MDX5697061.1 carbon-nitrogen hydrolase family protein [Brenneria sp. L4-2C]
MQIEIIQAPSKEGDIDRNLELALAHIRHCDAHTELAIFPETFLTGFAEEGHIRDRALMRDGPEVAALIDASRQHDIAIAIGMLEQEGDSVFNTTLFITPESGLAWYYRKTHLWFSERALVDAGDRLVCGLWRGKRIGMLICYDIEFPETARALAAMGCDLIVVTNGNMDPYGPVHRYSAHARAFENQLFFAMTNRCGEGAGCRFAGESAVIDPNGRLMGQLGRGEGTLKVTLDFSLPPQIRRQYDYLRDRRLILPEKVENQPDGQRWWLL